jgi:hypothetical protein
MLGDFQVMSIQQFITNKIINPVKSMRARSSLPSSSELKRSKVVNLISVFGLVSTLLLYIPIKLGIIEGNRFAGAALASAQKQQQRQTGVAAADPLSSSLQIAQSKVQAATSPGAWGHGVSSFHNLSNQDLLIILGITSIGCILAYLTVRIMFNRAKEKEHKDMIMYQQP